MRPLESCAAALVAPGKGILAADESVRTASARLAAAGVAPTGANRRAYRELLVTTPGLADGVTGVILCEDPALAAWHGDPACREAGQRALAHRVAMNGAALEDRYSPELELDLDPA